MKDQLAALVRGESLSADDTFSVFEAFVREDDARATDAQIGAYLSALAARLPTAAELVGAARCLRNRMKRVDTSGLSPETVLVDTCGTGGSGLNTFNTSTVVAIIAAATGLTVAKHGNRAATSQCGSADLLEALGVKLDLDERRLAASLRETGFAFLFAPLFHPATKRVQGIRKELGFRTIFNFLGPLVNPAGVKRQLLGVSNPSMLRPMADALAELGASHAIVACGEDGLDELSVTARTRVCEVRNGKVTEQVVQPEDFGFRRYRPEDVIGSDAPEAARRTRSLLAGESGARTDLVLLNAGAALVIGGRVETIAEGVTLARATIESGAAIAALEKIISFGANESGGPR